MPGTEVDDAAAAEAAANAAGHFPGFEQLLPGRQPASHTTRAIRWNNVSLLKRPRS